MSEVSFCLDGRFKARFCLHDIDVKHPQISLVFEINLVKPLSGILSRHQKSLTKTHDEEENLVLAVDRLGTMSGASSAWWTLASGENDQVMIC